MPYQCTPRSPLFTFSSAPLADDVTRRLLAPGPRITSPPSVRTHLGLGLELALSLAFRLTRGVHLSLAISLVLSLSTG